MEELKIIKIDKKSTDKMSSLISAKIDKILEDSYQRTFLEGIVYIGSNFFRPEVQLMFIYNDVKFEPVKVSIEEEQKIRKATGMDISAENIPEWYYGLEERFQERGEYPWEFSVRYGTILYDKSGKIKELQQDLKKDQTLDQYLDFWNGACSFEPPLQYKKLMAKN